MYKFSGVSIISPCPYYFFQFLAFCGILLMFWFVGVLSLSQNIFYTMVYVSGIVSHLKFTFPYHIYINVTLSRLIPLFMLIFLYIFLSGNFWGGCFPCKIPIMYNLYISQEYRKHDMCSTGGVPLKPDFLGAWKSVRLKHYPAYSVIIISLIMQRNLATKIRAKQESSLTTVWLKWDPPVDRNQILFDVASSDHIVHSTNMVNAIQLQYWHSFLCITFNRQLHKDVDDIVYWIFLNISVITNFHFYSLYRLSLAHWYGS